MRSRRARAVLRCPAHLAVALAPAQLAAHMAWAPGARAANPTANPSASPTPGRLGVSLDGGLVGAALELGALRRAAGCLLAMQEALSPMPNPELEPIGLSDRPAVAAPAARGHPGRELEVCVALQSLRMDVRTRILWHSCSRGAGDVEPDFRSGMLAAGREALQSLRMIMRICCLAFGVVAVSQDWIGVYTNVTLLLPDGKLINNPCTSTSTPTQAACRARSSRKEPTQAAGRQPITERQRLIALSTDADCAWNQHRHQSLQTRPGRPAGRGACCSKSTPPGDLTCRLTPQGTKSIGWRTGHHGGSAVCHADR